MSEHSILQNPSQETKVSESQIPAGETLATLPLPHCATTVRLLRSSDVRLLEWHGGADLRSFYEELDEQHQNGESLALVADYNNFPIALTVIRWQGKPTHPNWPDIQSVRVHPIFRGLKIGSHMLRVSEEQIASRGFNHASLSVALDNPAAQRLYERLGYRVRGEPYCDVWYYTDARGQSVRVEENVLDLVKELQS